MITAFKPFHGSPPDGAGEITEPLTIAASVAIAVFAVVLGGAPGAAHAQSSQTGGPTPVAQASPTPTAVGSQDLARVAFERGIAAAEQNQFDVARQAFEESYRLRPLPVVLYNLAVLYRGMGQTQRAARALEDYLRAPDARDTPEHLIAVRGELDSLRRQLVTLSVLAEPPYSDVSVDAHVQGRAASEITLDPGTHVLEVAAEGYRPSRQELSMVAGTRLTIDVRLESIAGFARILVQPSVAQALVSIDGRAAGTGIVERPVRPGDHRVEIRATGYETLRRTVHVGSVGLVRVDAELSRPPSSTPWIVLAVVGGAVLLAGGIVAGAVLTAHEPPRMGAWATVTEP